MTVSISDGVTTVTPIVAVGYASKRSSRNILHDVIGRSFPDATLYPASLRSGTLQLVFATEASGLAGETIHTNAAVLQLTDTDLTTAAMTYIVSGTVTRTLDSQSLTAWIVTVDFQEVHS